MSTLRQPLPEHLCWLTEKVEALVRPAAFLQAVLRDKKTDKPEQTASIGATMIGGWPDLPADAPWARGLDIQRQWMNHVSDGESFVAQINLAEVPQVVREQFPMLPALGVVWVTIEGKLDRCIEGHAYFDNRDAAVITWRERDVSNNAYRVTGPVSFNIHETLTCATDETLPEVSWDWREGGSCGDYDAWWIEHYAGRGPSNVQMGGWIHPIQGDVDEERKTVFMEFRDQPFGDGGAVYLHHCPERGFFVTAHSH